MIHWLIRYRNEDSTPPVDSVVIEADTQEAAEDRFAEILREEEMFGAIITIEPTDPLAHP